MTNRLIFILFSLLSFETMAQLTVEDYLAASTSKDSTLESRLKARAKYIWKKYLFNNPDSAEIYSLELINEGKKHNYRKVVAAAQNMYGISFGIRGRYDKAIEVYKENARGSVAANDDQSLAGDFNNIGISFDQIGLVDSSVFYYLKSIEIKERLQDFKGQTSTYNNIGLIYYYQGDYRKAVKYYSKVIAIAEKHDIERAASAAYSNLSMIYESQNDFRKSIEYSLKSLKLNLASNNERSSITTFNALGTAYKKLNVLDSATYYFNKAITASINTKDVQGEALAIGNLSDIDFINGNYKDAFIKLDSSEIKLTEIKDVRSLSELYLKKARLFDITGDIEKMTYFALKSFELSKETKSTEIQVHSSELLYQGYAKTNPIKALKFLELHVKLKDSLTSEENKKELIKREFEYDYSRKKLQDSIETDKLEKLSKAELQVQKAKNSKQKWMLIFGAIGVLLLVVFTVFIVNRLRLVRKQKSIIHDQKVQVDNALESLEEKNTEIVDSIQYAKRIQTAILPSKKVIQETLKDSFVLYEPKDIVAGDFYWMHKTAEKIFIAAADCTGHGVPGAMVSVICNNGLNRSVREFGLEDPGKILDKTRDLVIQEFEKSEEEVKDGMDIALCVIEGKSVSFSGAHNPLWILRNSSNVVEEIKADKQPIGKFSDPEPYTSNQIEVEQGDTIYIFSDGYADQFGGERGKKYKTSQFRKFLLGIQKEDMLTQKELLVNEFNNWKGDVEQLDDVCVIGIRF